MPNNEPPTVRELLRLTLARGLGPSRVAALLDMFGSVSEVCTASPDALSRVPGLGSKSAERIAAALRESAALVDAEVHAAERAGAALRSVWSADYPALLRALDRPPPILYVRGTLEPTGLDRYTVAIVGSRRCTAYGLEQAERFAEHLAGAGLTVVSGGARGIDAAAHRGALRAGGRTVAVLGCGLAQCYPPEHSGLFDDIAGAGALVSELPMTTPPNAENFPARNRVISGMSLGVVVIEAGQKSGALITARLAGEDHGREVMGVPGRVDSPASAGTLELLREGGAHLVTAPGDALGILENAARHLHAGTHAARYGIEPGAPEAAPAEKSASRQLPLQRPGYTTRDPVELAVLEALVLETRTPDELAEATGLEPGVIRAACTVLEIRGAITRSGLRYTSARRDGAG